jgi:hypothetical protein
MADAWDAEPEGWADFIRSFFGEDALVRLRAAAKAGREVRATISAETGHVFGVDSEADTAAVAAYWDGRRDDHGRHAALQA